jgi:hypothetical protein
MVHIGRAGERGGLTVPHFFQDLVSGESLAAMFNQVAQQLELARRQVHGFAVARHLGAAEIEAQQPEVPM